MQIQIEINDTLYPTLQRIAQDNALTPETYARNIVQVFLEKQYRGEVLDQVKFANIDKLKTIKESFNQLRKNNGKLPNIPR